MQGLAMVAYIYVPTTWGFAAMLFGGTLWNRKVIGDMAYGGGVAGVVLTIMLSTVIAQEVHFPNTSTQKLWLPCPAPPSGTWSAFAVEALDMSAAAKYIISWLRA